MCQLTKPHIYSSGKELTCMNHLSSTIDIDLDPVMIIWIMQLSKHYVLSWII